MRRGRWWGRQPVLLLLLHQGLTQSQAFITPPSRGSPSFPASTAPTTTSKATIHAAWSPSRPEPAYHPDPELPPTAEAIDAKLRYWEPQEGMTSAQAMDSLLELAYGYRAHLDLDHISSLLRRLVRETEGAPQVRQALLSSDARFGEIMDQARSELLGPNARLGDNQKNLPRILNSLAKLGLSYPALAYSNGPLGGGTSSSLLRFMDSAAGYLDWQVRQQNQPLNGQELSLVLHALGKMRWYGGERGAALVQALAEQAGSGRPSFLPHGLAMVVNGLANLNHHPGSKVMAGIIRALSVHLDQQTPQGLAMVLDSLGRLGWGQQDEEEEDGYHAFMETVGRCVGDELMKKRTGGAGSGPGTSSSTTPGFRPKEVAMVVDGLAKLRYDWEAYRGGQEVVEAVGREVASRVSEFGARDLAMVVYGLGNLNYRPGQDSAVGRAMVRAATSLLAWGPPSARRLPLQQLALLVYGLGKMGLRSQELLSSISHHLIPYLTLVGQEPAATPTGATVKARHRSMGAPKPVDLVMVLQGLSGMLGVKESSASTSAASATGGAGAAPRLAAEANTALSSTMAHAQAQGGSEQRDAMVVLQALLDVVQDQLPQFKPSELISTLDALFRLASPSGAALRPAARAGQLYVPQLSGAAQAAAAAGVPVLSPESWQGVVDDVVDLVVARVDRFRTRDLAILVFFLGKLGYECTHVSDRLRVGVQRRMWEFEGSALALLVWGLGRMGFWAGDGFCASFSEAAGQRLAELRPPQMVMMMEGLTRVGYTPRDDGVFLALFLAHASRAGLTDFSKDNLAFLVTDMRRLLDRQEAEMGKGSSSPSQRRLQGTQEEASSTSTSHSGGWSSRGYQATVRILEAAKARLDEMDSEEMRLLRAAYEVLPDGSSGSSSGSSSSSDSGGSKNPGERVVLQAKLLLMQRSMDDLKQLCRSKGLKLGGRKAELVDRLIDYALSGGGRGQPLLAGSASSPEAGGDRP